MKIAAVLPSYNEENTIGNIVQLTKKHVDTVIVVDNNSTDRTIPTAEKAGAMVFMQCHFQGAGAATRMGWGIVRESDSHDVMVTLDADGQHNPEEIPKLLAPMKTGSPPDIVIGSRFLENYNIPSYRKLGIDVITWLYNVGHKQRITDGQSCFRAYRQVVLDNIDIAENGFGFSTEVLVKARKLGFRIVEVPISCIYHEDRKQNSTLNPIRHGLGVAWKTIKWRIKLWN